MTAFLFVLSLVIGAICGYLAGEVAITKKWDGTKSMLLGFFFGPIGLIGAVGFPDRQVRKTLRLLAEDRELKSQHLIFEES